MITKREVRGIIERIDSAISRLYTLPAQRAVREMIERDLSEAKRKAEYLEGLAE